MAAVATGHERFPRGGDVSDAKIVGLGQKPPFWWVTRFLTGAAVLALLMLGITNWHESRLEQARAAAKAAAEQVAKAELELQRVEIEQLKAQARQLRNDLDAEIKVKQALAVRVERAEARTGQAVSDIKTVVNAVAKGVPAKKAPPPAQKRRG